MNDKNKFEVNSVEKREFVFQNQKKALEDMSRWVVLFLGKLEIRYTLDFHCKKHPEEVANNLVNILDEIKDKYPGLLRFEYFNNDVDTAIEFARVLALVHDVCQVADVNNEGSLKRNRGIDDKNEKLGNEARSAEYLLKLLRKYKTNDNRPLFPEGENFDLWVKAQIYTTYPEFMLDAELKDRGWTGLKIVQPLLNPDECKTSIPLNDIDKYRKALSIMGELLGHLDLCNQFLKEPEDFYNWGNAEFRETHPGVKSLIEEIERGSEIDRTKMQQVTMEMLNWWKGQPTVAAWMKKLFIQGLDNSPSIASKIDDHNRQKELKTYIKSKFGIGADNESGKFEDIIQATVKRVNDLSKKYADKVKDMRMNTFKEVLKDMGYAVKDEESWLGRIGR